MASLGKQAIQKRFLFHPPRGAWGPAPHLVGMGRVGRAMVGLVPITDHSGKPLPRPLPLFPSPAPQPGPGEPAACTHNVPKSGLVRPWIHHRARKGCSAQPSPSPWDDTGVTAGDIV